jgi:hypothetical protein
MVIVGLAALAGCGDLGQEAMPLPGRPDSGMPAWSHDGGAAAYSDGLSSSPSAPPSQGVQAGTLTAGSFDDHYQPALFDEFMTKMASVAPAKLAKRALIEVADGSGQPVTDAKVTVRAGGQALVSLTTGSDGQTLYLPELDGDGGGGALELLVEKDGQSATFPVSLAAAPWRVKLGVTGKLPQSLDLAFIVDATGSMTDEITFLKVETESIAQQVKQLNPNLDLKFALIVYRDQGDDYVTRVFDFASLESFKQSLAAQAAGGGGDTPEAMDAALLAASKLSWRTGNTARVAFLIGDAPPHDGAITQTLGLMDTLRKLGVRLYPLAASGVDDKAEFVFRVGAFKTLARYIFLTDDSGYGNTHADPNVPPHTPTQTNQVSCYNVEKLNPLMVRMIRSELAGRVLPPAKAEILKQVGTPVSGICDPSETATP